MGRGFGARQVGISGTAELLGFSHRERSEKEKTG